MTAEAPLLFMRRDRQAKPPGYVVSQKQEEFFQGLEEYYSIRIPEANRSKFFTGRIDSSDSFNLDRPFELFFDSDYGYRAGEIVMTREGDTFELYVLGELSVPVPLDEALASEENFDAVVIFEQ